MNAPLQAYLQGPEPRKDSDHTSLQRQALEEVLHLSAVVPPLEAQIESDYGTAKQQAQTRLAADKSKLEVVFQAQSEEASRQRDARLEAIRADYETQLGAIKVDAQRGHSRVSQKATELVQAAEKEYQDQTMVADFVAEGAATRVRQERLEVQAAFQAARRHLDMLGAHADRLLRFYRQSIPQPDQGAESPTDARQDSAEHGRGQRDASGPTESHAGEPESKREALRLQTQQALAEQHLKTLGRLFAAQLFAGARPLAFAGGLVGLAVTVLALLYFLKVPRLPGPLVAGPVAAGLAVILAGLGGRALWRCAKRQVRREFTAFRETWTQACAALDQHYRLTLQDLERQARAALEQKETELRKARETLETTQAQIAKQRATSLQEIDERGREALKQLKRKRDEAIAQTQRQYQDDQSAREDRHRQGLAQVQARYDQETAACENEYRTSRRALEERWDKGLACIRAMLQDIADLSKKMTAGWDHLLADSWTPAQASPSAVRFGAHEVDLRLLAEPVRARTGAAPVPAGPVVVPALLEFPRRCSILLQAPREGRQQAIETLRAVMMRLFTSLPPGRVRFTILDPVALGESFAGFMHAGDYQEALVGGRIWTETAQIQQQLEDLTQHMENVIQKYLRNEFETIEQYNEQAGELAEPYRFLVIADFPTNFSEEAARRLSSIIHSGPRCGVHTLIAYDTRHQLPAGIDLADISANSIHLVYEKGGYVWQDRVLRQFPLTLDRPPDETTLTRMMHVVGQAGARAARVEVPFEAVAPADARLWSLDSREEICIPLGRTGATRLQYLRLGRGVAQHALIAGKTGSGKSTLFHVMVTNLALWYAPDQVELYLIDFKQGVEFKTYVTHHLPHARAIAIESDREFGLSILRRLEAEMAQRGEVFRTAGVQDIGAYRQATGTTMPRTVLIVDEFQTFFAEDDRLAQDAAVLLEQLVRQGRAFGIHVVLGSQTLGGVFGLARSTIGQMAIRVALQCSEADSQLILDDENVAARLLARPGEAIYNDVGGRIAGNSPFQVAWLSESCRDSYLSRVAARAKAADEKAATKEGQKALSLSWLAREPVVVFEGRAPADIRDNRLLAECLDQAARAAETAAPRIWLGAPVTMKGPTAVTLRRQSGANLLLVGQRDEVALNLMAGALVGLAAQLPPASAQFVILDGSSPEAPSTGVLARVAAAFPHTCRRVPWREVQDVIAELAQEVQRRVQAHEHEAPAVILMVYGLQRYRVLRRSEDGFGLSLDDQAQARPDVQFAELLRDGPAVGVHVVAWADTLSTLERVVDRQTQREFDHRVLFQMSAADSSNLIDSPIANQLGLHRALLFSEEQGGLEKFRPYDALTDDWLADVRRKLAATSVPPDHNT
jgi:S-DNA-T family DNA segregation ATPase FtsK/SpoIIIE